MERKVDIDATLRAKPPVNLLIPEFLRGMSRVQQHGDSKYEPGDWKTNRTKKGLTGSLFRHLLSYMDGEELDSESGLSHLYHISVCGMYLDWHEGQENETTSTLQAASPIEGGK